jgi:predicted Zn-dependent protease
MSNRREKLEHLLDQDPNDVFLNFSLAMELAREGAPEEALARFDHVLTLDASYIPAHHQKGTMLIALRRFDQAGAALRAGVEAARAAGDSHAEDTIQTLLDTVRR